MKSDTLNLIQNYESDQSLAQSRLNTLLGLNIRSLGFHHDELNILLSTFENKPVVLALTETWIAENDPLDEYDILGYQPIESTPRLDCKRRSGGVAFYVKDGYHYKPIDFNTEIECSIIEIRLDDNNIKNACVIYRPDTFRVNNFLDHFEKLLHFLNSLRSETVIFGDFNIDTLVDDTDSRKYTNLLKAFGFEIQNSLPTRITIHSKSCIDHIITQRNNIQTNTIKTTISDHFTVMADFCVKTESYSNTHSYTFRNLRNLKNENAVNFLFFLNHELGKMNETALIDDKVEYLAKTIMRCVDKYAPERKMNKLTSNQSWITNEIKNLITKRDALFQKWILSPTEENHKAYKTIRNKVTQIIRTGKKQANYDALGKNPSPKKIYATLKSKKRQSESKFAPDADAINEYFAKIGSVLAAEIKPIDNKIKIDRVKDSMVTNPTNSQEVTKILKHLKNKKSSGHDGISNEILKCCSPVIEPILAKIFNEMVESSIYPDWMKLAKITPLYKKGDRNLPENYRPISLISSLSKVFEKLLLKRMMSFCAKHKVLTSSQFGFRPKMSCVQAIVKITEYLREQIDKKMTGQACFIDLKKAFDTLNHDILLHKLEEYGFRGKINEILKSFLEDRKQYVRLNEIETGKLIVQTGVPQGSVLGPFLFLIYINDLPSSCDKAELAMFADDTTLIKSGKRIDPLLSQEIKYVRDWFSSNKLTVNPEKCEAMCFGYGKPDTIKIGVSELKYKASCRYLGIHLDKKLLFREHIDYVVKKLNKFCGLIYRVRHIYPRKCLLMFYNSFAKSVICYGLLVYGSAAKTNLQKIEYAQRRILRAIFFKKKD